MTRLSTLVRRIVKGVKKHMFTSGLAFGLMLIPLGYYLVIEGAYLHIVIGGYLSITAGITLFLIGWIKSIQEEKQANKSNNDSFNELITEIRGLRQDLKNVRQGENERNNKTQQ